MKACQPEYSVVIPVYNSATIVGETIRRTCASLESANLSFELILVNDASTDDSWNVISDAARRDPRVIAINLLRNSGQHAANLCGFRASKGAWVVTMDDDLQNPPAEIHKLIAQAAHGHDMIIGRFEQKRHAAHRRLGSRVVRWLNRQVFGQERDLVLSNFRLIRRDVVDRICAWRGPYPYVPGLCLMFSADRANAFVEHHPRAAGKSNYSALRIARLIAAILFNYSSFPLRCIAGLGSVVAVGTFILGLFYLIRGLLSQHPVPGWTSLVVLLAFFNAVTLIMLSMLGEYVVRIINQLSTDPYIVRERVDGG